jgi:hypothetical protein
MRKLMLAGATAIIVGGVAAGSVTTLAWAQPAPPAAAPDSDAGGPPPGPPPGPHPWMHWMGWMNHGPHGPRGGVLAEGPRTLALLYHPADRHLAAAEVQKIAEAFLLWNGNRDWKVTQVAPAGDGLIGFAFATQDGGVIARFTMDSKTGRVSRVG